MKATQTDLAWLAGFWDGEGSVGLIRNKATRILVAQLSHTELGSIRKILEILEAAEISGRGYTYQERDPLKHRDAHYLRVTGVANVLKLAELLLPYSVTKHRHWEIAIQWSKRRIEVAGGIDAKGHLRRGGIKPQKARAYLPDELLLADELSALNTRGPASRKPQNNRGRIAT